MSSRTSDLERWEELLGLKTPEQRLEKRWLYWLLVVCLLAVFIPNIALVIRADDLRDTVHPASQVLFWILFAGAFVGPDGIFLGAGGRAGEGMRQFGRKLRVVCMISFLVFVPFYFAAMGGSFVVEPGGYRWTSGLLVGGGIGSAFTLFCLAIIYIGYRRRRRQA